MQIWPPATVGTSQPAARPQAPGSHWKASRGRMRAGHCRPVRRGPWPQDPAATGQGRARPQDPAASSQEARPLAYQAAAWTSRWQSPLPRDDRTSGGRNDRIRSRGRLIHSADAGRGAAGQGVEHGEG